MKTLKIKLRSLNQFNEEALRAMQALDKGNEPGVRKESDLKDTIFFESQTHFQKFFNLQKIELLSIIKRKQLANIYELSNIVNREFQSVMKDASSLSDYGFINLIKNSDNQNSYEAKLAFNYDQIVIDLPTSQYSISLAV